MKKYKKSGKEATCLPDVAIECLAKEVMALKRMEGCEYSIEPIGIDLAGIHMSILMEYAPCGTLAVFRKQLKSTFLEPSTLAAFTKDLTMAVKALHAARLIHNDIKDRNVMIMPDGRLKLADYGWSFVAPPSTPIKQMMDTRFSGTMVSNAPEKLLRKPMATYKSDWWAVGVLLYVLAAKRFPFDTEATMEKAARQQEIVRLIHYTEPDYTGEPFEDLGRILLTTVIRGLLVKQPRNRWDGDDIENSEWGQGFLEAEIVEGRQSAAKVLKNMPLAPKRIFQRQMNVMFSPEEVADESIIRDFDNTFTNHYNSLQQQ